MFRFTKYAVQYTIRNTPTPDRTFMAFPLLDAEYGTTFGDIPKLIAIRRSVDPGNIRIVSVDLVSESNELD